LTLPAAEVFARDPPRSYISQSTPPSVSDVNKDYTCKDKVKDQAYKDKDVD